MKKEKLMRCLVIAAGILFTIAAACASGQPASQRIAPTIVSNRVEAKPDNTQVENENQTPPGEMAEQPQPKPAEKTARQLSVERQDRLDTKKRENDAQDALADLAVVENEDRGIVITFRDSILFAPEQATLLPSSHPLMNKIAIALLVTKDRDLIVEGHTDSKGTANSNIDLSRHRAEAVRTYLIAQGYPAARIRACGIGQDHPVATNASSRGRAENRRIEIIVNFDKNSSF